MTEREIFQRCVSATTSCGVRDISQILQRSRVLFDAVMESNAPDVMLWCLEACHRGGIMNAGETVKRAGILAGAVMAKELTNRETMLQCIDDASGDGVMDAKTVIERADKLFAAIMEKEGEQPRRRGRPPKVDKDAA